MGSAVADTSKIQATQAYARIHRKAVLHRMETAECLEDRVYWAIVLLSWCGPGVSDYAVVKDHRGFIQKNLAGVAVRATFVDICAALGLAPTMKGSISRSVANLCAKGAIRKTDGKLYPIKDPEVAVRATEKLQYAQLNVAGLVVSTATFSDDEEKCKVFISVSVRYQEKWRTGLRNFKYELRNEYVQELFEHGIIIDRK